MKVRTLGFTDSCFLFFLVSSFVPISDVEETLLQEFIINPWFVLICFSDIPVNSNLLEQKWPLFHEGLQFCAIVYHFTLGVEGALYLIWIKVSLITEHLHFDLFLLLAFRCLTHWHDFTFHLMQPYVSWTVALCVAGTFSVSYSFDSCAPLSLVLKNASHFEFGIVTIWPVSDILFPPHQLIWHLAVTGYLATSFLATSVEAHLLQRADPLTGLSENLHWSPLPATAVSLKYLQMRLRSGNTSAMAVLISLCIIHVWVWKKWIDSIIAEMAASDIQ